MSARALETDPAPSGTPTSSRARLRAAVYALVFAALLIGVYWHALGGDYLWDDDTHYTANTVLEGGGLLRTWLGYGQPNYWPLTWTSFWLEHRLFGFDPVASHTINVLLHAGNAALLWLVLRRLRFPAPMIGALVFLLHPTNVETVAWVTQRKNLLCAGFALASCLGFVAQLQGKRGGGALGVAGFMASLLSKGAAIGLPLVFAGLVYWRRRTFDARTLRWLAPYFALSVTFAMVEWGFMREVRAGETIFDVGFAGRAELIARNLSFYVSQTLWPVESIFVRPRWALGSFGFADVALGLAFVALGAVAVFMGRRAGLVTWVGYGAMLAPILGATDAYFFKYSYVADHYLYLALPFAALAVAWLLSRVPARAGWVIAVVLCGAMAAASFERSRLYVDDETLWRATLQANDEAWIAHSLLGVIEQQRGEWKRAREHYMATLRLDPPPYDRAWTELNLGNIEMLSERPELAREHYERSLALLPETTQAWTNLAATYLLAGDRAGNDEVLTTALEAAADRGRIHALLARSLEEQGRSEEARIHAERAEALLRARSAVR